MKIPKSLRSNVVVNGIRKIIPAYWLPIGYLTRLVQKKTGLKVAGGPFKGLQYVNESVGSAYIPKVLGIYERELNPIIYSFTQYRFSHVIDIGAAEGYYANGLAKMLKVPVIAFDMEEKARVLLKQMIAKNNLVETVKVEGKCEAKELQQVLSGTSVPLIVCDVEGYENSLLDPVKVPQLKKAFILVELHRFVIPEVEKNLRQRFCSTHTIEKVEQEERGVGDFPYSTLYTRVLPKSYLKWAVSEWRPEKMSWLWLKPVHTSS